jgi:glycosyltransferase involved in cell wall biosynthesis
MLSSAFATAEGDVEIVARLDDDDPSANAYPKDPRVTYITGPRPTMMSSLWNECWDHATGDIGMLAGDDIIFQTHGWDRRVNEAMRRAPDRLVMVYTNDETERKAPVLPFISRRWADLVGFTTNDFPGWFADEWIWAMAAEIRRVVFLDDVIVHHFQLGDDATYQEAAMRRYQMGNIDGLRARFYSPELVAQRDILIASLRAAMREEVELEPVPRPLWFEQSLSWAANARPSPLKVKPKTLVVIHCWQGDRNNVIDFLPYHKRHGLPILLLSPENAPVTIHEPGVTCHSLGVRGYYGQESLERQRAHLGYLLTLPFDYFLLNDADSICLEPQLPDYLFADENRGIIWSNEVPEFRPHASPYPKVAMQPPYFMHRSVIERLLTVDVACHPITPYIDWYMLALAEESHTPHKSFPDGASFPAWRRNQIAETQKLGHEFKHEYDPNGVIAGDTLMLQRVREGAIFVHSIKHKPVMDMLIAQRNQMTGRSFEPVKRKLRVSILVPFRSEEGNDQRDKLWEWIERRWRWMAPEAEIVIGEDTGGTPFSKTTAVNDAFMKSTGDILIVADADAWLEPDRFKKTIAATDQRQRLIVPWARVYRIDKTGTESLLKMDPTGPLPLDKIGIERGSPEPITAGTIFAITRRAFETVNGMDPRFRGWGFEDISFRRACDVLIGRTTYLHLGVAYSMWHEAPSGEKGRVWENDGGQLSIELNNQYRDAEQLPMGAMRALCDEHPLGKEAAPMTPRYMRVDQTRSEDGDFVVREPMWDNA